ncbi:hypothetical protein [Mesorhizobium sp. M0701]|uniref:hypothetical protein n=1 Tax=Mesorhizobium sp. M0701 TaxID=2956989 RepID=UPI00333DC6CD
MIKSRVADAGVSSEKPAPSVAAVFVWHPATAELTAQMSSIQIGDFRMSWFLCSISVMARARLVLDVGA